MLFMHPASHFESSCTGCVRRALSDGLVRCVALCLVSCVVFLVLYCLCSMHLLFCGRSDYVLGSVRLCSSCVPSCCIISFSLSLSLPLPLPLSPST